MLLIFNPHVKTADANFRVPKRTNGLIEAFSLQNF